MWQKYASKYDKNSVIKKDINYAPWAQLQATF